MGTSNINWPSMTDKSIIFFIGAYIKDKRLFQNKTQAKVAEAAGINRWTMSQIENGEPISLISLIQILRALNLLEVLEVFKIETQISPLELAKLDKQKRQRARTKVEENEQKDSEW